MRVPIKQIGPGQHPSEEVVQLETKDGPANLVVDKRSIENNTLDVGYPIGARNGYLLVELPCETMTGEWRVWVLRDHVLHEEGAAA
jgi:hypothetical protein